MEIPTSEVQRMQHSDASLQNEQGSYMNLYTVKRVTYKSYLTPRALL